MAPLNRCKYCGEEKPLSEFLPTNRSRCRICVKKLASNTAKLWYQGHKEIVLARNKENYYKNKEKYKEQHKQWRDKNKQKCRDGSSAWKVKNKSRLALYWKQRREKAYAKRLQQCYGLTVDDYNCLLTQQNNACAVCGQVPSHKRLPRLVVDHDHLTGKVRGLLCHNCNTALGLLRDDINTCISLCTYVQKHKLLKCG